jgi:hypothetical protein
MSKKNYTIFLSKGLRAFLSILLLPLLSLLLILPEPVSASQLVLTPVADAFVRANAPNRNYGSWNDITIGNAWNLGNYFSDFYAKPQEEKVKNLKKFSCLPLQLFTTSRKYILNILTDSARSYFIF